MTDSVCFSIYLHFQSIGSVFRISVILKNYAIVSLTLYRWYYTMS